jgi:hypothetical protein
MAFDSTMLGGLAIGSPMIGMPPQPVQASTVLSTAGTASDVPEMVARTLGMRGGMRPAFKVSPPPALPPRMMHRLPEMHGAASGPPTLPPRHHVWTRAAREYFSNIEKQNARHRWLSSQPKESPKPERNATWYGANGKFLYSHASGKPPVAHGVLKGRRWYG